MVTLFTLCALVGGTILACQFVMTLMGLGDSALDGDLGDNLTDLIDGQTTVYHGGDHHHHSSWLFGIISFRTLVAATTFFGMAGMFANRSGASVADQLLLALLSGGAALFGVHWLMKSFYNLGQSGTLNMSNAIEAPATVTIPIPPDHSGQGKVQLQIQGRLEDVAAVTSCHEKLSTGMRVKVTGVLGGNVVEVMGLQVVPEIESQLPQGDDVQSVPLG